MFFIKYFALLAITVAVEEEIIINYDNGDALNYDNDIDDESTLINDINGVLIAKNSKTCVIFVCDGNVMFVSTEPESKPLFTKLDVAMEKVNILRDTYEAGKPFDIFMKLSKLRAMYLTFVVYFTEEDSRKPMPKPSPIQLAASSPLPEYIIEETKKIIQVLKSETIVILVKDGIVKFVSTEPDSDRLLKDFQIQPGKFEIIKDTFERSNPTDVIDKLNNYRRSRSNVLIFFKVARSRPPVHRYLGLLVPEFLLYDINDLLLVQKVKTVVIFVRNGKVQFVARERDIPRKLAELGFSLDKLKVIKDKFDFLNPFDILGKLSKLRYDTENFLVYFTQDADTEIPELSGLVDDITDVVLKRKSKTCVIWVSGGRVKFITTEADVAQKKEELGISDSKIEIIKETFKAKNPFDILGKLVLLRSKKKTFLVYFTEDKFTQSPGYMFPESVAYDINNILIVKKSKTVAIYVLDGRIELVTTEADWSAKLAERGEDRQKLEILKDTFDSPNPFDILRKLSKYLNRRSTFLIIFTQTSAVQFSDTNILVNSINDILLKKKSKICVIYVFGGKIMFVTSGEDAHNKIAEFKVPLNIETIRKSFDAGNPESLLKLFIQIRNRRDTFLVYFTAVSSRKSVLGLRLPSFNLPNFSLSGFQSSGSQFPAPGAIATVESTQSNGGLFGLIKQFLPNIDKNVIISLCLDLAGLKTTKKVTTTHHFGR